jgi:hypothetical protein
MEPNPAGDGSLATSQSTTKADFLSTDIFCYHKSAYITKLACKEEQNVMFDVFRKNW